MPHILTPCSTHQLRWLLAQRGLSVVVKRPLLAHDTKKLCTLDQTAQPALLHVVGHQRRQGYHRHRHHVLGTTRGRRRRWNATNTGRRRRRRRRGRRRRRRRCSDPRRPGTPADLERETVVVQSISPVSSRCVCPGFGFFSRRAVLHPPLDSWLAGACLWAPTLLGSEA